MDHLPSSESKSTDEILDELMNFDQREIDCIYDQFSHIIHDEYINGADMDHVMIALFSACSYVFDILKATEINHGEETLPETFNEYMQEAFGLSIVVSNE